MLNQVVLVGRIVKEIEIESKEEKKVAILNIAIPRCFKNANGEYDTDFIECVLWNSIAENVSDYCKKGDIVGVKGRVQSEDGKMVIVAEKVTFLSSKRDKDE